MFQGLLFLGASSPQPPWRGTCSPAVPPCSRMRGSAPPTLPLVLWGTLVGPPLAPQVPHGPPVGQDWGRAGGALACLVGKARAGMAWLAGGARRGAARGTAGEWTTPMGVPVVQPYRAKGRKVIRTLVQSFVLQFDNDENKVQKNKQRSAFPPNYIHSVDSAHMMKTAVACHAAGLVFAGVHDSFWTHAGDVPEMSKHIREKFIELHSEPLLEQLYEEVKQKYPEIARELPPPPPPGSRDLQSVRVSRDFLE